MAQPRTTLMDPPIEELLDKVDSKFTLVALAAKRGRQINSYYNQLGEGLGYVVPPQVTSVSGKSLTIAFEEIAEGKAVSVRREPGAEGPEGEGAPEVVAAPEGEGAPEVVTLAEVDVEVADLAADAGVTESGGEEPAE